MTNRFTVVAGPNPGVEHADTDARLRDALTKIGATHLTVMNGVRPVYSFVLHADTLEDALATLTIALRSVYGRAWWADVTPISDSQRLNRPNKAQWN